MTPHLDLYAIYGLDQRMPPTEIGQRLTEILNATADPLTRGRIETARAILADPQRRTAYDRQLADPAAPPITEQTLAQLAGRPAPTAPGSGSGLAQLAGRPKVVAGIAAALALLLVVIVTAVSCSGSDSSSNNAGGQGSRSADNSVPTSAEAGNREPINAGNDNLDAAVWRDTAKGGEETTYSLQLTKEIALPNEFSRLSGQGTGCTPGDHALNQGSQWNLGITQLRDSSVAIVCNVPRSDGKLTLAATQLAVVNKDGQVVSTKEYGPLEDIALEPFDLPKQSLFKQYFHVEASNGITVPTESTGLSSGMVFVTQARPDAFDEDLVWVLLRGSDKLYQAKVLFYRSS
ncbi:hypothetical protein SAMN04488550_0600 [Gordonia malaquae]|uniref:J domain-containing protein n=1 Tax=Gordonia malaquae NBRC 108250 TaxID=1223542 RepID=M3UYD4_GORML|nr:hypothetical protein [Gordonia malaquae]GAC80837.1 hypothetical protein GM1_022_00480 [Gordonia malaquae NBRC 108250]SEB67658.1 hypothetical protein SAMN04488550_0600 [Gordonia malaquae]